MRTYTAEDSDGTLHVMERYHGISQPFRRHNGCGFHKPLRLHVILGTVHTVNRNESAAAQVDDRKRSRRGVASQKGQVVSGRKPDRLELEIELIRPEPGRRLVRRGHAANRLRGSDGHVVRVLDGLEPNDMA